MINQNRLVEANDSLMQLCELQPLDPLLKFKAAWINFQLGRYEECERLIKGVLSLQVSNSDAHYYLGLTLLKQNRLVEALSAFREACELKPGFALSHFHWGICLYNNKSYKGALGQFKQALNFDENLAATYYYIAATSLILGQKEDVVLNYKLCLQFDSNFYPALIGLSQLLYDDDHYQEALDYLSQAAQIDNEDTDLHKLMAQCFFKLGYHKEALEHFQYAANLNSLQLDSSQRATLFNNLAVSLFNLNYLEEACEKLIEAIQIDKNLVRAQVNLGLTQEALGEHQIAQGIFSSINNNSIVNYYAAINNLIMGNYTAAAQMFEIIENDSFFALDYFKGIVYLSIEDINKAESYLIKATEDPNTNYLAYDALGCVYYLIGDYPKAVESLKKSIALNENFSRAYVHLAQNLLLQNDFEPAIKAFESALTIDPNSLENQKKLIYELIENNEYEIALSISSIYERLEISDPEFSIIIAKIFCIQKNFEEALAILNRVITHQNETGIYTTKRPALAHVLAGQIYLEQQRAAEADYMFRVAVNLNDNEADTYLYWGKTLSMLGMEEFAIEKFEKGNELDPFNFEIYEAWANSYKKIDNFEKASQIYNMATQYI